MSSALPQPWRRSEQVLLPACALADRGQGYRLYPSFDIAPGLIERGWVSLAGRLPDRGCLMIDGYAGVFWKHLRAVLDAALQQRGVHAHWQDVSKAGIAEAEIAQRISPCLGGDDPLFGTRYSGSLSDWFDGCRLRKVQPDAQAGLSIVYGCGAALANWDGPLWYVDLPKNEIQYRARAGAISNLGTAQVVQAAQFYKRAYFVDWPVLNRHKAALLSRLDGVIDGQRPDDPTWMQGDELRTALRQMSQRVVRPRPWFEPGPWGGQWLKQHIPALPADVPNYAWSFELIAPENGIILQSGDYWLEITFDTWMFQEASAVLGFGASDFGSEFPIRFDYLDTMAGGNLSVQVHPRPDYIGQHFGETFTQDETYYIHTCESDATVWLGLQEAVDPVRFRAELEHSVSQKVPVNMQEHVQQHPAKAHDLFLIPHGTIHGSGVNNLVLEISATPYIFTFKMYDWLRLGLDGQPRTLNLARAFANIDWNQRGGRVAEELLSQPRVIKQGEGWVLEHLPTHARHFYDIHRYRVSGEVEVETLGSCHVLNVVAGPGIEVEIRGQVPQVFHHAETFVIPAAVERYRLKARPAQTAWVILAFLKAGSSSSGHKVKS